MTDKKLFQHVMIVLALKLGIIIAAAIYIFGPMRAKIDKPRMEQHLLQGATQERNT